MDTQPPTPSPISRTWAAFGCLAIAVLVLGSLTPNAEVASGAVAAVGGWLAALGFRRKPFTVPGLIADSIALLLATLMVGAIIARRF